MKKGLPAILAAVINTQLALESLRAKDVPRTLELLEVGLDASVLALNSFAKDGDSGEREQALLALRQIRSYRQVHPRRVEADLATGSYIARSARVAEARVSKILREIE